MNKNIFKLIRCPKCKSDKLLLKIDESIGENIISGRLECQNCNKIYQIKKGIPFLCLDTEINNEVKISNIQYHDKMSKEYESDPSTFCIWDKHSRKRINEILNVTSQNNNGILLDVGCGTGNILTEAKKYFNNLLGIDISLGMLEISNDRGFNVSLADSDNIPIRDNSVNAITAFSVLHHLKEPNTFFNEAYRVLKKNGFMYTDLDPNYYAKIINKNSKIYNLFKNMYYRYFLKSQKRDEKFEELQKMAEYHHHYTDGFKKHDLYTSLSNIGFREIKVICHGNSYSIYKNSFFSIPYYSKIEILILSILSFTFSYSKIAPNILIIAKK